MTLYYIMPLLTNILLGTILISSLTKLLNHPKGTLLNGFFLILGNVAAVFIFTALLPESVFTLIAIYGTQLIIIMKIYDADLFMGLLFLLVGFVFGTTIAEILAKPVANLIMSIL